MCVCECVQVPCYFTIFGTNLLCHKSPAALVKTVLPVACCQLATLARSVAENGLANAPACNQPIINSSLRLHRAGKGASAAQWGQACVKCEMKIIKIYVNNIIELGLNKFDILFYFILYYKLLLVYI